MMTEQEMVAEISGLRALVGTIREMVGCEEVLNVSDCSPEQHSREIGAALRRLRQEWNAPPF